MAPVNTDIPQPTASAIPGTLPDLKSFILNVTKEASLKKQHAECKTYGTFMTHFSRSHLEGIFWGLFVVVILLLCTASFSHAKSEELHREDELVPNETMELKKRRKRLRLEAVITTTICFLAAAGCVALEGLAGTALNYCQQHKVINFYWAMWGLTQVGGLIAILGVTIHQWAGLRGHQTPPWNVALGTPILVISWSAVLTGNWLRNKWKNSGSNEELEEKKPVPIPGTQQGIAVDGDIPSIVVHFHGREWKSIPGFQLISQDETGGATGKLAWPVCHCPKQRPGSQATIQGSDSNLPVSASVSGSEISAVAHLAINMQPEVRKS